MLGSETIAIGFTSKFRADSWYPDPQNSVLMPFQTCLHISQTLGSTCWKLFSNTWISHGFSGQSAMWKMILYRMSKFHKFDKKTLYFT